MDREEGTSHRRILRATLLALLAGAALGGIGLGLPSGPLSGLGDERPPLQQAALVLGLLLLGSAPVGAALLVRRARREVLAAARGEVLACRAGGTFHAALILCVALAALAGIACPAEPGWERCAFGSFGLAMVVSAAVCGYALVLPAPLVLIDDRGIHDAFVYGLLPWGRVRALEVRVVHDTRYLFVRLEDEDAFVAGLPLLARLSILGNRWCGLERLAIWIDGVEPGGDDLLRALERRGWVLS